VTVFAALVVPTVALENVRLAGETVTGAEPVPVRLTVWGLSAALSLNVREPARAPVAVGENVTPTVHVAPAAMLVPQVLLAIAKSPAGAMLENANATFWWLVSVTDFAALVLPTSTVPKLKLLTESVTGAVPVPVSAVICGLLLALSATLRVPDADPTDVGVNAMRMVQLAPPAKVPLEGHVPPVCPKAPLTEMLLIVRATVCAFLSVAVFAAPVVPSG
jgi:hypothetical protein